MSNRLQSCLTCFPSSEDSSGNNVSPEKMKNMQHIIKPVSNPDSGWLWHDKCPEQDFSYA